MLVSHNSPDLESFVNLGCGLPIEKFSKLFGEYFGPKDLLWKLGYVSFLDRISSLNEWPFNLRSVNEFGNIWFVFDCLSFVVFFHVGISLPNIGYSDHIIFFQHIETQKILIFDLSIQDKVEFEEDQVFVLWFKALINILNFGIMFPQNEGFIDIEATLYLLKHFKLFMTPFADHV